MHVCGFNAQLAKEIGVLEATFLQILYQLIHSHKSMCVIEDGLFWFPCSIKEWANYIDFWSYHQTDRIVKRCLFNHTLYLRHYDEGAYNRRSWYAIDKYIIPYLEVVQRTLDNV